MPSKLTNRTWDGPANQSTKTYGPCLKSQDAESVCEQQGTRIVSQTPHPFSTSRWSPGIVGPLSWSIINELSLSPRRGLRGQWSCVVLPADRRQLEPGRIHDQSFVKVCLRLSEDQGGRGRLGGIRHDQGDGQGETLMRPMGQGPTHPCPAAKPEPERLFPGANHASVAHPLRHLIPCK